MPSPNNSLTLIYDFVRTENSLISYDGGYRVRFFLKLMLVAGGVNLEAMKKLWECRDKIFAYVNGKVSTNFIGDEDIYYFYENAMPSISMLVRLDCLSKLPIADGFIGGWLYGWDRTCLSGEKSSNQRSPKDSDKK